MQIFFEVDLLLIFPKKLHRNKFFFLKFLPLEKGFFGTSCPALTNIVVLFICNVYIYN